jgi:sn1-specific diacylglycerol lipase
MRGELKEYKLLITGHSLGAGCAAVLSLLLRSEYPSLRCLAFSVPGCVFSEGLAEQCGSWVTSYILDADIVPRISIGSFEDLRDRVLKTIYMIKVPKQAIWSLRATAKDDIAAENERVLYRNDEAPDSDFKRQVDSFLAFQEELKDKSGREYYIDLYPPGKLIQLFRVREARRRSLFRTRSPFSRDNVSPDAMDDRHYVARWVQRGDLRQVHISSHMLRDHEPGNVKRQIHKIAADFNLLPPLFKVDESFGIDAEKEA